VAGFLVDSLQNVFLIEETLTHVFGGVKDTPHARKKDKKK
jgi:hypothetical protein